MGRCKYCGALLEDTDAFCAVCGKPVQAQAPQAPLPSIPKKPQPKPLLEMSKPLLPVILLLVALGAVGTTVFLLSNKGVDTNNTTQTSSGELEVSAASTVTITFLGGGAQEGSTQPLTCSVGDTITLPTCGFVREGYKFDCWEDDSGHSYAPGDQIEVESEMTFWAVWTTSNSDSGEVPAEDDIEENESDPSASFPRQWSGSFEGYSQHVTGGTYNTSVKLTLSSVSSGGRLAGTCYIGYEDPQARTGSYHVEGHIDWTTGEISLVGTSWENQGDLEYMRSFDGVVNSGYTSITGTSQRNDGSHQGYWSMYVD